MQQTIDTVSIVNNFHFLNEIDVMKPKDFVVQLRTVAIDENVTIYRDLFASTPLEKASDTYWERALSLFKALSPERHEIFFEVMRQVAVDTTSSVLGVIDGITIRLGV